MTASATLPLPASAPARPAVADAPAEERRAWLQLSGLHCAGCALRIEEALRGVDGVRSARVAAASGQAEVCWDPQRTRRAALIDAVRRAGYRAAPATPAAARALRRAEGRDALWRLFVAGFCAMQVMMLAWPSYVAGPGELAPDLRTLLNWGQWLLTLPVMLWSAAPIFSGAWSSVRSRRIGMDVPVALGLGIGFLAGTAATFEPGGPFGTEVWFDSITMFASFLLLARWVEMRVRHNAAETLEAATATLPARALRLRADGAMETVPVRSLRLGDRVCVPVGQAFPADGCVEQGDTEADEALLSGESRPVAKGPGGAAIAGSVNLRHPVVMRVERVGDDTRQARIAALMREALAARPVFAGSAERWAGPFLWAVLLLAAGAAIVWGRIDPSRALPVAVAVLIVTCPCALSLAVPAALSAAAARLARSGVLLRRPEALEALARVQRIFIDKTGTLTEARLALERVEPCRADIDAEALLPRAAALAAWSAHPLSVALRDAAGAAGEWQDVTEQPGCGLEARDAEGRVWRLGSAAWVGGACAEEAEAPRAWFGPRGEALACFVFGERLRDDARDALAALQADGVRVALLSGDAPARVEAIARRLGLRAAAGGLTPEDKLAALRRAQHDGEVVAMVGDGINDAPVLAQADLSFAMGQGAALAKLQADAVLLRDRLSDLVAARRIAQRTRRVIRQNLTWAAAYNAACVPLALAGFMPPWAAGLGMAASSLAVVLNALRLAR